MIKIRPVVAAFALSMMLVGVTACGDDTADNAAATASAAAKSAQKQATDAADDAAAKAAAALGGSSADCAQLSVAFGRAIGQIMTDPKAAQASIESLKSKVPDSLSDDIDTLLSVYAKVQKDGIAKAGEAASSPEYKSASEHLTAYFGSQCKES